MKRASFVLTITTVLAFFFGSCEKISFKENFPGRENLNLKAQIPAQGNENITSQECTTISSGKLLTSQGFPIKPGYDKWGYNYQAQIFNGTYCNAYQNAAWCQAYAADGLSMKWNDAWLSKQDCDGDFKLDRHYGYPSYIGSGAWLTNHMWGTYVDGGGKTCKWDYFVKIIAAPADGKLSGGKWFNADGSEIGPVIWGEFAIIQEIVNDPCAGIKGLQFVSPDRAGLGDR